MGESLDGDSLEILIRVIVESGSQLKHALFTFEATLQASRKVKLGTW